MWALWGDPFCRQVHRAGAEPRFCTRVGQSPISPINFEEELMRRIRDTTSDGYSYEIPTEIIHCSEGGHDFYLNPFYTTENIAGTLYLNFETRRFYGGRNNVLYIIIKTEACSRTIEWWDEAYFTRASFQHPPTGSRLKAVAAYREASLLCARQSLI